MKKLNYFTERRNSLLTTSKTFLLALVAGTFLACGEQAEENAVEEPAAVEVGEVENETEWNYENTDWETGDNHCATKVQSPIDIDPTEAIEARLPELVYEYEPFQMNIVDNGHTIQLAGSENSAVVIDDVRYEFLQMHFHAPSEHTLNGETFPMEMHLVHRQEGKDNLLVLGIFIEEGAENEYLGGIFSEFPEEKETEVSTELTLDLDDFIPEGSDYYTYLGSLTTPPCTVGVNWFVFGEAVTASAEQIAEFTNIYEGSARPVQPLENRRVFTAME